MEWIGSNEDGQSTIYGSPDPNFKGILLLFVRGRGEGFGVCI